MSIVGSLFFIAGVKGLGECDSCGLVHYFSISSISQYELSGRSRLITFIIGLNNHIFPPMPAMQWLLPVEFLTPSSFLTFHLTIEMLTSTMLCTKYTRERQAPSWIPALPAVNIPKKLSHVLPEFLHQKVTRVNNTMLLQDSKSHTIINQRISQVETRSRACAGSAVWFATVAQHPGPME